MSCSLALQGRIVAITGKLGLLRQWFLHVKFLIRGGAASAIITRAMFCNSSGNGMDQTLRKHHFSRSLGLWFQIRWKSAILGTLFMTTFLMSFMEHFLLVWCQGIILFLFVIMVLNLFRFVNPLDTFASPLKDASWVSC